MMITINKAFIKIILQITFYFLTYISIAQTVLTHNIGNDLIDTSIYTCSNGEIEWARSFVLEDFGITSDESFIITQGEVGFSNVGVYDVNISFNIYEIDNEFPDSFSRDDLIGSSQVIRIYQSSFQLVTLAFDNPIKIPSYVERILVEVRQSYSSSSAVTFIAGTAQDNDVSWFNTPNGCPPESYTTTEELGREDARFYINVTGEEVLSIEESMMHSISIFPNPVDDNLVFNLPLIIDNIEIFDLKGDLIKKVQFSNNVDVSTLSKGIYFARLFFEDQNIVKRFVKK